jgi:hypothetical protein
MTQENEHKGCRVVGYVRDGAGRGVTAIAVRPERGAWYHNAYYATARVEIPVAADGKFEAVLVPSQYVGKYVVDLGPGQRRGQRVTVEIYVPNSTDAIFDRIIVRK